MAAIIFTPKEISKLPTSHSLYYLGFILGTQCPNSIHRDNLLSLPHN